MDKPILANWLSSSSDPTQISNTVRGAVLSASALIVFFAAKFFGLQLGAQDVVALATQVGALAGVVWFFYGLLLKGTVKLGSIRK